MTDTLLWESEGMIHHIWLDDTQSPRGDVVLAIRQVRRSSQPATTAILSAQDRFDLAKALYPAAFEEGPQERLHEEYGVQDRNGRMMKDHSYLTPFLASLVGFEEDETLMVRNVGNWRTAPPQEEINGS